MTENKEIINASNASTKFGISAGLLMMALLMIFQISGNDFSPWLKLSKYIVLAILIIVGLNRYKSHITGDIFIKGFPFGLKLSVIAGLVLALTNIILYLVNPELSFSKYSIEPTTGLQLALVSAVLFFEVMVFGGIITFATLQYLKESRKKYDTQ